MGKQTVSAGGVILNPHGDILLVNQRGNSWSLPKGHVDDGEDLLSAARREIREESGVEELHLVRTLGSYQRARIGKDGDGEDASEMKTLHFFLFTTEQMALQPEDKDNPEARWVPRAEAASMLSHPSDREFLIRVLTELPLPGEG